MRLDRLPISVLKNRFVPGGWDVLAFVLVFALLIYVAGAAHGLTGSLPGLEATPISLAPGALVGYAARTALRMLIAMLASIVFTFTYATLAAKSRRAEIVLVPLLDILQSLPILGFSITIVFFLSLTPGRVAGPAPELVQQMMAERSRVSAICRAASAMASPAVDSGWGRCAAMTSR